MAGPMIRSDTEKILNRNSKSRSNYVSQQLFDSKRKQFPITPKFSDHVFETEHLHINFFRKSEQRRDRLEVRSKSNLIKLSPETIQRQLSDSRKPTTTEHRNENSMTRMKVELGVRSNNHKRVEISNTNSISPSRTNSRIRNMKDNMHRTTFENRISIIENNVGKPDKSHRLLGMERHVRNQQRHVNSHLQTKAQYRSLQFELISQETRLINSPVLNVNLKGTTRRVTRDSRSRVVALRQIKEYSESLSRLQDSRRKSIDRRVTEKSSDKLVSRKSDFKKQISLRNIFTPPKENELTVMQILLPDKKEQSNTRLLLNTGISKQFRLSRVRNTSTQELRQLFNSHLVQNQRIEMHAHLSSLLSNTRMNLATKRNTAGLNINTSQFGNIKNYDNRRVFVATDNRQVRLIRKSVSPASQFANIHRSDGQIIFKEDSYPHVLGSFVEAWSSTAARKHSKTEKLTDEKRSFISTEKSFGLFEQLFYGKNATFSIGFDVILGFVILAFVIDDSDKGILSRFKNRINRLGVF